MVNLEEVLRMKEKYSFPNSGCKGAADNDDVSLLLKKSYMTVRAQRIKSN